MITNKDPVSGDIAVYYARFIAVNGILVRAFVRSEGVCVWGVVTTSVLVIATAPVSAATVMSASTLVTAEKIGSD